MTTRSGKKSSRTVKQGCVSRIERALSFHRGNQLFRFAGVVGCAVLTIACGPRQDSESARRRIIELEFERCQSRERYGEDDADSCWRAFLREFRGETSIAEEAYATEHLDGEPSRSSRRREPGSDSRDTGHRSAARSRSGSGFPPANVQPAQCFREFQYTGDSRNDVIRIGELCGAPAGHRPFSEIRSNSQDSNDQEDVFGIELRNDRCYAFFAVGSTGIDDLDTALVAPNGEKVASDIAADPFPVFRYCPSISGRYKYVVAVIGGSGTYHYQVWEALRQ